MELKRIENPSKMRVAVLCGGRSGEREVSLRSGAAVEEALKTKGFMAYKIDVAEEEALVDFINDKPDVAFVALHGRGGEDGTIQGFLETLGVPYTGSGIYTSATAINKIKTKKVLQQAGIRTSEFWFINRKKAADSLGANLEELSTPPVLTSDQEERKNQLVGEILAMTNGLPCVIKPATEGSSLGMTIAHSEEEVFSGLLLALKVDEEVMAEPFIAGTELTVASVGTGDPEVLPVVQITIPDEPFYNYEAKYKAGGSTHICPAPISEEATSEISQMAAVVHRALYCEGVVRTDIILDDAGKPWVLEVNTSPGMTETSLVPDAVRALGFTFEDFCVHLVALALEK